MIDRLYFSWRNKSTKISFSKKFLIFHKGSPAFKKKNISKGEKIAMETSMKKLISVAYKKN